VTISLPVDAIDASGRLRPVDPGKVQLIADSILAWRAGGGEGSPAPITVRPCATGWKLVAGAHRLAAAKLLDDTEIEVNVHELDDLQARLMEIDENLCRAELNALDRATFLAERDSIWREMYPEKDGRKGSLQARWHSARPDGGDTTDKMSVVSGEAETFSFAADARGKIGLSERSIRREVKLYRMLSSTPELIDRVRGTWLEDHQGQLFALARIPAADRADALSRILREENPLKNFAAAVAEMRGVTAAAATPDEKAFSGLVAQWTRASAKTRGRFLDHLHSTGALDGYLNGTED
jgi:ParB family chromosome partitioning protein